MIDLGNASYRWNNDKNKREHQSETSMYSSNTQQSETSRSCVNRKRSALVTEIDPCLSPCIRCPLPVVFGTQDCRCRAPKVENVAQRSHFFQFSAYAHLFTTFITHTFPSPRHWRYHTWTTLRDGWRHLGFAEGYLALLGVFSG